MAVQLCYQVGSDVNGFQEYIEHIDKSYFHVEVRFEIVISVIYQF